MTSHTDQTQPFAGWPRGAGMPAQRALVAAGYTSLEALDGASEEALLALHGVGPKAIRILRAALAERGLALRP